MTGHLRPVVILALCSCTMLAGCRTQAPVVRHFLRMPAEYAGGLSGIQRAAWLKASRRSLPSRKTMTATGQLTLAGTSTKRGRILLGLDMLHTSAPGGNGGLAIVVQPGETPGALPRLHLLEQRRFVYKESPLRPGSHVAWRIDPTGKTLTAYDRRGAGLSPVETVRWTGTAWSRR